MTLATTGGQVTGHMHSVSPVDMWTPHAGYLALGASLNNRQETYRDRIGVAISTETIAKIRHCANTGLVLGTEEFRAQVEAMRA